MYRHKEYVYVRRLVDFDFYKIGMTVNYKKRSQSINTDCPFDSELVFLFQTYDMLSLETVLHSTFKDKKVKKQKRMVSVRVE